MGKMSFVGSTSYKKTNTWDQKPNSEQMETRMYCSEKKCRMIVVSKAEQLQEWINLDLFIHSQEMIAKGNVFYCHMV